MGNSLSKLELIGLALFALLALNLVLDIDISIKPRSWLGKSPKPTSSQVKNAPTEDLEEIVLPSAGVVLPVRWTDLGVKMTSVGVIDAEKFKTLYDKRGSPDEVTRSLLLDTENGNLVITRENSGVILNFLWALGLGNKNPILERGPMAEPQYGGAGNFASTGGWSLARGQAMDHYSRHPFLVLTPEQQQLVERVSKNIYRPCCNNSTYFPDCNHGMAMLALLELMASQGVSEDEMYANALQVNAYWFPDTYLTIAKYLETQGISWKEVEPQEILGYNFSSASGYQRILAEIEPQPSSGGGSCGI